MYEVGNSFHPVASERSKDLFDEAMKDGYVEAGTSKHLFSVQPAQGRVIPSH